MLIQPCQKLLKVYCYFYSWWHQPDVISFVSILKERIPSMSKPKIFTYFIFNRSIFNKLFKFVFKSAHMNLLLSSYITVFTVSIFSIVCSMSKKWKSWTDFATLYFVGNVYCLLFFYKSNVHWWWLLSNS